MEEIWVDIYEFPNYAVSNYGRIRNTARSKIIKLSKTKQGAVKVNFALRGRQYTRSVKVLVAEAFVDGRTYIFDTPMHLDGDQENNIAENIVWRPRWFALKYSRQFDNARLYNKPNKVYDKTTGEIYNTILDAAKENGLLCSALLIDIVNQTPCFPTGQIFDWVKK